MLFQGGQGIVDHPEELLFTDVHAGVRRAHITARVSLGSTRARAEEVQRMFVEPREILETTKGSCILRASGAVPAPAFQEPPRGLEAVSGRRSRRGVLGEGRAGVYTRLGEDDTCLAAYRGITDPLHPDQRRADARIVRADRQQRTAPVPPPSSTD